MSDTLRDLCNEGKIYDVYSILISREYNLFDRISIFDSETWHCGLN